MNPYIIDTAPFKKQHITYVAISFIPMVISYVLANKGYSMNISPALNDTIKWLFLGVTFGVSFLLSGRQKARLKIIQSLPSFDEQVAQYQKLYDQRLLTTALIGVAASVCYALTARRIFLIFAIFDLVILLIMYPNKTIFRRELNNPEITFK
ncbi:hypothetical protein HB364_05125 [Pseudoflavitalea sp. X16]|uniref:hypothetical protein n=1 Tax=Paraflavitalea devenefica TaxID=2716334 RepID=UPI0014237981|nr:hypothetical protein [Paraflavitalea devenefica]NII24447.1 hypothetical protein [Paraflavitalea devenefica]